MIGFAKPDPYLLTEPKQRSTQKTDCDQKKKRGSVFVLQLEERARKSNDEQQRRAHRTG
jgi:hypothetical protein